MEKQNNENKPVVFDEADKKTATAMAQAVYCAMLCALYVLREYCKKGEQDGAR